MRFFWMHSLVLLTFLLPVSASSRPLSSHQAKDLIAPLGQCTFKLKNFYNGWMGRNNAPNIENHVGAYYFGENPVYKGSNMGVYFECITQGGLIFASGDVNGLIPPMRLMKIQLRNIGLFRGLI